MDIKKSENLFLTFFDYLKKILEKNNEFKVSLYNESIREYNFKIKVSSEKLKISEDIVIYYSPKRLEFTFNLANKSNISNEIVENLLNKLKEVSNNFIKEKFLENNVKVNNIENIKEEIENNFDNEGYDLFSNSNNEETKKFDKNKNNNVLLVYVDGSFFNNKTGYGGVILTEDEKIIYQFSGEIEDENIKKMKQVGGEIEAVIFALKWIKENIENYKDYCIKIYYDYEGLNKWINGEWKTKNIYTYNYKNEIINILNEKINIEWIKVKSHSKDKWNNYADILAKKAIS